MNAQVPRIERKIHVIRGQRVMLSGDLAALYGVVPAHLARAVKRNLDRFPPDFMFELTVAEFANLRSQFVTSSWGGSRFAPLAFTEQGVAMLSSVLRSRRAVDVNIAIMRAFVRIRELAGRHKDLVRRLDELEKKYDGEFRVVFEAIRILMRPQVEPPKRIEGFLP